MANVTYVPSGNLASSTADSLSSHIIEQGGGNISWGNVAVGGTTGTGNMTVVDSTGISATALNYKNRMTTSTSSIVSDAPDLYGELQNLIATFTKVFATVGGISTVPVSGTVATSPTYAATPRSIIFRIQQMCTAMLTQPNV